LINQRQGGRRRGRGGQRGPNIGGQPGNRQDNRQRGNAAQLLEKYKSLARDAQLAGDRVQTEYYLQYADHYFRVLSESRARFEDHRRQRDDDGDDDLDEDLAEAEGGDERQERQDRPERAERAERPARRDRGNHRRFDRDDRDDGEGEEPRAAERSNGRDDSLPLDVLPPAIGADGPAATEEAAEPAPRKRTRTRRPAGGEDEVAPAA
jgi:hypothetical protein